jgi:hypothetical protein
MNNQRRMVKGYTHANRESKRQIWSGHQEATLRIVPNS